MEKCVGAVVKFGRYMGEPVEWLVLEQGDGRALLLSKYGLEAKPFNSHITAVTWETCTLRNWLNKDFYGSAFDEKEKEGILVTKVVTEKNPENGGGFENDTQDKLFVLTSGEVKKYLGSNEKRICFATEYAKKNGVFVYEGKCAWWLRSPGEEENCGNDCLEVVQNDGSLFDDGVECIWSDLAVRPAMWVDLSKMEK